MSRWVGQDRAREDPLNDRNDGLPVPDWLVEVVRPRQSAAPWPRMIRMPIAIGVPIGLGLTTHHLAMGLPLAMGGLVTSVVDRGGPYAGRVKRIGTAAGLGAAPGLTIGVLIHGTGWLAVAVIVALSLVSALVSAAGATGSVTGLQLLLFAVLGSGPLGTIRPWWSVVGLFLIGALWGIGLSVLGWPFLRRAPERRTVASVYQAIARLLRATGTDGFPDARQAVVSTLDTAYGEVCGARATSAGADPEDARLVALLGGARRIMASALALAHEGTRPPPAAAASAEAVAATLLGAEHRAPVPHRADTAGTGALSEALGAVHELLADEDAPADRPALPRPSARDRLGGFLAELRGGRLVRRSALRLTLCMGVAATLTEVAPLQRSYWVMLTVTVVLKPDFGSVFARALQRGIGTVIGAVLGAVVLAIVPYGPLLLIPIAVFAFLAPYGISRNYGLFATFLTPIVVLLIDLLTKSGWSLAQARAIDTLAGCGIVLLLGYAPWPSSWYAHVGPQFADAVGAIARYLDAAFADDPARRGERYRQAFGRVSDLRTVFQRALAEPAAVGRRATAWYPGAVALDRTLDAITATSIAVQRGRPAPDHRSVRQVVVALDGIADAVHDGGRPSRIELPDEPPARPIADAVRGLREQLWPSSEDPGDARGVAAGEPRGSR